MAMVEAYILIQAEVGRAAGVADAVGMIEVPPCKRAQPPPDALLETCSILDTVEDPFGTSALLSFKTQQGGDLESGSFRVGTVPDRTAERLIRPLPNQLRRS
jgi:hypothetical protein